MASRRLALFGAGLVALVVAVATVVATLDGQRPVLIEAPSEPRVQLVADVEKPRYLATRRMLEVILRNEGRSPLQIERLQLRTGHFTRRRPTVRDAELQPGVRLDMPISYGRVRCAPGWTPSSGGQPSVVVQVRGTDGQLRAVPLVLPRPNEVLDRLRDDECDALEIRRAVDVGFGSSWAATPDADDAAVRGSLLLRRRATSRPVTLLEVAGTVIFDLRTVPRRSVPFARMAPGVRSVELPIEVSAARCDPHALTESKKTFRFPLWVSLGDNPEHHLEIEPHGHGRRLLEELLKACARDADD